MVFVNDELVNVEKFPNNESRIFLDNVRKGIEHSENVFVKFKYLNDSDLIELFLIKKAIDEVNKENKNIELFIEYMPYSRQDRRDSDMVFTLKYVTDFINCMNFSTIEVLEPHSDVTLALLNNSLPYKPANIYKEVIEMFNFTNFDIKKDFILFPDTGALKRYEKYFKGYKILVGSKVRDFETGKIKELSIIGSENLNGSNVIIIDDLCSKGGTFILSGNKLKEINANKVYLVVTHCENSVFDGDILKENSPIDCIYTTDSIIDIEKVTEYEEKIKIVWSR